MRPAQPEPGAAPDTRAVIRCPGCGAHASVFVKAGSVRALDLVHEDHCTWLLAAERGIPVAPVLITIIKEDRP